MPKLTIGMATFMDYHGVYFTIQNLRMNHADVMNDVEFVVVDQAPNSPHGQEVHKLIEQWVPNGRYVPMVNPYGTSASRNKVFDVATGDAVLCMDCHVFPGPGSIKRLIDYYDALPNTMDLYQGPLVFDNMSEIATHFNSAVWRAEMQGIWAQSYRCKCRTKEALHFSTIETSTSHVQYVHLATQVPVNQCGNCGLNLPGDAPLGTIKWNGHEQRLRAEGYEPLGWDDDSEAFEIPSQGLGLFTCRKEAWLGFNEHHRGFGGEECYIHEKFRQYGRKAYCLPFLKWLHRFGRPDGIHYRLTRYNKVRNYVLEFLELGKDLDPIYQHFVKGNGMPEQKIGVFSEKEWDHIVADPVNNTEPPADCQGCQGQNGNGGVVPSDLDDAYEWLLKVPRDLEQHMPKLKRLAGEVDHVTEFSKRRESTVALAAGRREKLISYNIERDNILDTINELDNCEVHHLPSRSVGPEDFEETDMLFIDSQHTANQLLYELDAFAKKVRKYIVMHDTTLHAETGEDGGPGLLTALRHWLKANTDWVVIYNTDKQYGLTVISRAEEHRKKLPSLPTMAWNYTKALSKHYLSGGNFVDEEVAKMRLDTCALCPKRTGERCSSCGCYLAQTPQGGPGKVLLETSECPLGFWDMTLRNSGLPMIFLIGDDEDESDDGAEAQVDGEAAV